MREASDKLLGGARAMGAAIKAVLATTVCAITLAGFGGSAGVATAAPEKQPGRQGAKHGQLVNRRPGPASHS